MPATLVKALPLFGTVIGNNQILCGNVKATYWIVTPMKDSVHPSRDGQDFVFCSSSSTLTIGNPVLDPFNLLTATPINPVAAPTPGSVPIYTDPIHSQTPDTVRARSTVPPMCIPSWSTVVRSSGRVISAHVSSELTFYKPLTSS